MGTKTNWTPADYLLRGRYCDTDTIQAELDTIRESVGAVAALIIAFRGAHGQAVDPGPATPFRSLLLFSHSDEATARSESKLLSLPVKPGRKVTFDPAHPDRDELLTGLVKWAPAIASYLRREIALLERRPEPGPSSNHGIVPAQFRILLFDPSKAANQASQDERLDQLLYMINGSAPVVVHGNLAGERDVDAEMKRLERMAVGPIQAIPGSGHSDDTRVLSQMLLDAALRLTGSSAGNVYFATSDKRLQLITETRNAQPLNHLSRDDPASVVAWVYRRERPMVLNDIRDFHRSVLAEGEDAYAELAVPIVESRLRTGGSKVIGVINVEKVKGRDEGHYTYRDLTVVRLIANRFGASASQDLITRLSRSLVGLALRQSISVERGDERGECSQRVPTQVPIDAVPAKPTIDEMLAGIYEVTRSHSATVRLVTNDLRHLVRFSAFPAFRLDEGSQLIGRNHKSVNAWVALTGKPCYLGSVRDPRAREAYPNLEGTLDLRRETASEVCEPIFVAGRVVGCMNLESRYGYGYDDVRDAVRMVAGQIGLALEHARRSYEQEVFSMTIAATANLHEIFKRTAELRRTYPGEAGADIADAIEHLVVLW
jgi:GAF domain-containing protein